MLAGPVAQADRNETQKQMRAIRDRRMATSRAKTALRAGWAPGRRKPPIDSIIGLLPRDSTEVGVTAQTRFQFGQQGAALRRRQVGRSEFAAITLGQLFRREMHVAQQFVGAV